MANDGFRQGFCRGWEISRGHGSFHPLLELPREAACDGLAQVMSEMTREQFREFEIGILNHCLGMVGQLHRRRAIELYAFIRAREVEQFGSFSGFAGSSEPAF